LFTVSFFSTFVVNKDE